MNSERRNEIDSNASYGDGNFGAFYMSVDRNARDFSNRHTFKELILSLMNNYPKVAEDIIEVVQQHFITPHEEIK